MTAVPLGRCRAGHVSGRPTKQPVTTLNSLEPQVSSYAMNPKYRIKENKAHVQIMKLLLAFSECISHFALSSGISRLYQLDCQSRLHLIWYSI